MCERSIRPGRPPVVSTSLLHLRPRLRSAEERATDAALAAWSAIPIATSSVAVRKERSPIASLTTSVSPGAGAEDCTAGWATAVVALLGKRRGTST